MTDLYSDFVYTRTLVDIDATATTIDVEDVSLFPSNTVLAKGDLWLTFESPLTYPNTFEVVKVTSVDTVNKTLTVVRGQDGTTAAAHPFGTYLKGALTAGMLHRARAGLSGTTVPTGTDPDLYQAGDPFYETSTGKSYVYDSTSGFTVLSGGGGALDTAMPTPSTPTVFQRGLIWGIKWDGMDSAGSAMPAGFQRAVIEQEQFATGSYASVGVDFDASGLPNATPAATPTGWTAIAGASLEVTSGAYAADVSSSTKPGAGWGSAWIGVECSGTSQRIKLHVTNGVFICYDLATLDGSNWTSTMALVQPSGAELSLSFVSIASDNTYVIGAAPTTTGWTGGTTFDLQIEGTTYTLYDGTGAVFSTGSTGVVAATGTKIAISPDPSTIGTMISATLTAAAATSLGWKEIASLPGAGVTFTTQTGAMRISCENEAGNKGATVAFTPAIPNAHITLIPPASADPLISSPSDVSFGSLADGDVLTYNNAAKVFTNKQPSLPGFPVAVTSPTDQEMLLYSSAASEWQNADHTQVEAVLVAAGDVTGPLNALVVGKLNGTTFGDAATKNVGTIAGTVAAGDDSRFGGPFSGYTVENSPTHGQILVGDTTAKNVYWMGITTALPQAQSAKWYAMVRPAGAISTSSTLGNGVMRLVPVFLSKTFNIKSVAVNITGAGDAGCVVRIGFYAPRSTNTLYMEDMPKSTLGGTGVTVAADSIGVKTVDILGGSGMNLSDSGDPTVPMTGYPFFWLAVAVQGVTTTQPTLTVCTPTTAGFPIAADSASAALVTPPFGFQATGVTGAFANNPTLTQCSDVFPMVACLTV